jgi:hypothetical protein
MQGEILPILNRWAVQIKKKKKQRKKKADTWQTFNLHKMMPMLSLQQDIMRWKH